MARVGARVFGSDVLLQRTRVRRRPLRPGLKLDPPHISGLGDHAVLHDSSQFVVLIHEMNGPSDRHGTLREESRSGDGDIH